MSEHLAKKDNRPSRFRRMIAVAALAGVTLGVAGCEASQSKSSSAPIVSPTTEKAPLPNVNIGTLPAHLPAAVRHVLGSVVSVDFSYQQFLKKLPGGAKEYLDEGWIASGVRVAKNDYLSAGHLVKNGHNAYLRRINQCGNVNVHGPSSLPTALAGTVNRSYNLYGSDLPADRLVGSFIDGDLSSTPDVSLLHAPDTMHTLPNQEVPSIAKTPVTIGEDVYFVNYQPTLTGLERSPSEQEEQSLNGTFTSPPQSLKPAVFGGVVIGFQANGDPIVADDLVSYDRLGDKAGTGGASGGAVFNGSGQLISTSIEGTATNDPFTPLELVSNFNENLTGVGPNAPLTEAIIQPITEHLIDQLERELKYAAPCEYSSTGS